MDLDGFEILEGEVIVDCELPNGYVDNDDDCDDLNAEINFAVDICDQIDNDCIR